MSFAQKRKYERTPYVKPLKFYLKALSTGKSGKSYGEGVSVDISKGGLGMITQYTLWTGDILRFEPEIQVNDSIENTAIVRWVSEIEENKYRIGTEFIK